jgi:hypothetical protein
MTPRVVRSRSQVSRGLKSHRILCGRCRRARRRCFAGLSPCGRRGRCCRRGRHCLGRRPAQRVSRCLVCGDQVQEMVRLDSIPRQSRRSLCRRMCWGCVRGGRGRLCGGLGRRLGGGLCCRLNCRLGCRLRRRFECRLCCGLQYRLGSRLRSWPLGCGLGCWPAVRTHTGDRCPEERHQKPRLAFSCQIPD